MVAIEDFLDEHRRIDWPAYRQARRDAGEDCVRCGGYIAKPTGEPSLCEDCEQAPRATVCPHCGGVIS